MSRTYEDVTRYVEDQSQGKCKVLSAKTEHTFDDLGHKVNVWNVKTDNDGDWWVVEGDQSPMNLYPQGAYYFSADEVYSFHIGIMQRMFSAHDTYNPEEYVKAVTLDNDIAPTLFRKLKNISALIDKAIEIEDFQAIGVQCREILIELGNSIYTPEMAGDEEQPQASNFKKKAELFIKFYMSGSGNSEYRSIIKKMTEGTWDYACKITHSQTATFYEVSTCVSLTISLVSMYENVRQKSLDPISQFQCPNCKSKKFNVTDSEHDENGVISKLFLQCEECGEVTQIDFVEK